MSYILIFAIRFKDLWHGIRKFIICNLRSLFVIFLLTNFSVFVYMQLPQHTVNEERTTIEVLDNSQCFRVTNNTMMCGNMMVTGQI